MMNESFLCLNGIDLLLLQLHDVSHQLVVKVPGIPGIAAEATNCSAGSTESTARGTIAYICGLESTSQGAREGLVRYSIGSLST